MGKVTNYRAKIVATLPSDLLHPKGTTEKIHKVSLLSDLPI